ncbi:leucine-rich repeat domain-containing protein [Spirosoma gilvum]
MRLKRQLGWFKAISLLLIWITESVAQPALKPWSELDRLPFWHPVYKPVNSDFPSSYSPKPDAYSYENFNQLLQQAKQGKKIESLSINRAVCEQGNLSALSQLKSVRVLSLNGLTAGQTDSLFQAIQNWSALERLVVFGYVAPGIKTETARLVVVPDRIQQFPKLTDIRLNGDYRLWQQAIEKMSGLKSLFLDQTSVPSMEPMLLDLSKLHQLEQLRLSGQNWVIKPELFSRLTQLRELSLAVVKVDSTTFQQTINGLTSLNVLTLDNIRSIRRLSLNRLTKLNEFYLVNNSELTINTSDFANLPALERLTLQVNQPVDLSGICTLARLQSLRVSGRGTLMNIPDCLGQLNQLTELHVENLKLDRLPASIGSLRQLKKLDVSYCGLDSLPAGISQLTALEELHLSGNKLGRLPDLGRMRSLRRLDANANQLTTLPDAISQLTQLTTLEVARNKLTQLPGSLNRLASLRTLILDNNQLERLPDDLGKLRKLHRLSLQNNQLRELPTSIGQLDSLQDLSIGTNRLKSLPEKLGQLRNLTDLTIGTNELTALPATIGGLRKLIRLTINTNPITELPSSICELQNLESLTIMGTQLRLLPDNIGALTKLQQVMLSNNELIALPNSIGRWQDLLNLSLDRNRLEGLPNSIGRLSKLHSLRITGKEKIVEGATGGLRQLPDSLIYCTNLWDVAIERQPQLDADDAFTKLARLKKLYMLSLPECNISQLPTISWKDVSWGALNLHQNRLTELPVGILDAPRLSTVSLWENRLPESLNQGFHDKEALRVAFVEAGLLPWEGLRKPNRRVTMAYQQMANQKARTRDWSDAMADLQKAIDYAPDTILALPYAHRASMHFFRKEYADALADYDKAIEFAPLLRKDKFVDTTATNRNLATYWQQKAAILGVTGQQEGAFKAIRQAERFLPMNDLTPLSGVVYTESGRYLAQKNKLIEADSSFCRAIRAYEKLTYPDPGTRLTIVELSLLTGQYDRARRALNNLPAGQIRDGYEILKEYLTTCLSVLKNEQTGTQAMEQLNGYLAKHPAKVYGWSFDLFDGWLNRSKLASDKLTALRQLTDTTKERLVKPQ